MSPRRSSRASRSTQPTLSGRQPTNSLSSSSSMASGRASRSAGPDQNASSPRSSIAARSHSSEDPEGATKAQARKTRSSQEDIKDDATHAIEDDIDDEGEEEVTRCICGNQEYPGLPVSHGESTRRGSKGDPDGATFGEDTTGWFIQCDGCKVWQHGGCVGIMDEVTSPDDYFCEQCRKDLHKVTTTSNGRTYSLYLPVQESKSPLSSPMPAPKKHSKRSKDSKEVQLDANNLLKGRRSTMNSRETAFEEEQLRIAIEESKREGGADSEATSPRKGKRSRSESEERNEDAKRRRTASDSTSSISQSKSQRQNSHSEEEIEELEKAKPIRGAAARNHKNKEARDREVQREKERGEASRRKGRTGREHDPGSVTPEPPPRTVSARGAKLPPTSFSTPAVPDHPPPKPSHKKTGRPPARKGRVGRNQYTKDRDPPAQPDPTKSSPAPSNGSQNADGGTPLANGNTNGNIDGHNGVGKPSRPRHMNPNRTTMNDMKRRVAGILEFISHTQVEMAGMGLTSISKSSTSMNTPPDSNSSSREPQNGKGDLSEKAVNAALLDLDGIDEQAFAALSSLEMMEVLTRRLMRWQGEYGKWGDK